MEREEAIQLVKQKFDNLPPEIQQYLVTQANQPVEAARNPNLPSLGFTPGKRSEYLQGLDTASAILNDPRNSWMGMGITGFVPKMWKQGIRSMTPVKGVISHIEETTPVAGHPAFTPIGHHPNYESSPAQGYQPGHPVQSLFNMERIGTNEESTGRSLQALAQSEGGYEGVRTNLRRWGANSDEAATITRLLRDVLPGNQLGRRSGAGIYHNIGTIIKQIQERGVEGPQTLKEQSDNAASALEVLKRYNTPGYVSDYIVEHPYMGGQASESAMQAIRRQVDRMLPGFGKDPYPTDKWPKLTAKERKAQEAEWPKKSLEPSEDEWRQRASRNRNQ